jgi:hypothetical protein
MPSRVYIAGVNIMYSPVSELCGEELNEGDEIFFRIYTGVYRLTGQANRCIDI